MKIKKLKINLYRKLIALFTKIFIRVMNIFIKSKI